MSEKSISVGSYFECPDCKHDMIDEVMTGVTVSTSISDLHFIPTRLPMVRDDMVECEYGLNTVNDPIIDGGVVERYQCIKCGWVIRDEEENTIRDPETLFEWLVEHKENREKELNTS